MGRHFRNSLKQNDYVCANHFKDCDIKSTWESDQGSNKYTVNIIYIVIPELIQRNHSKGT